MEFVTIMRVLWRRRLFVALGALIATALATTLILRADRSTSHAVLASRLLAVDTPMSELVNAAPAGADSLGWRTALLAGLAASEPVVGKIARDAGIPVDQLTVVDGGLEQPLAPSPLSQAATEAAAGTAGPNVLTVRFDEEGSRPLISLEVRAPERRAAARIIEAATATLQTASAPAAGAARPFVVEPIAPMKAKQVLQRPRRLLGIGAGLVVFSLWCGFVVVLGEPSRRRRPLAVADLTRLGSS